MAKRKSKNPTWSDVKSEVAGLDQKKRLKLGAHSYRLSEENKSFIHARFAAGGDSLALYKKTIDTAMSIDMYKNKPIQISKAKKAISRYLKAAGDPLGEIDLMIFFVECGNHTAMNFGDMDTGVYDAIGRMYGLAIEKVLNLPEEQQGGFKARIKKILTTASAVESGYYDMLYDEYYSAFPEDE